MIIFYIMLAISIFGLWKVYCLLDKLEDEQRYEKRIEGLTIHQFAVLVSQREKGKKEVDIAQIKEILKVVNNLLSGELYKMIKQGKKVDAEKSKNCCCK